MERARRRQDATDSVRPARQTRPDPPQGSRCHLFGDEKTIAAALKKLSTTDRTLLARLADGVLEGARYGADRWSTAYHALRIVGDETSLAAIDRNRPTSGEWCDDINNIIDEEYVAVIRRRLKLKKLPARVVKPRRDGKRLVR